MYAELHFCWHILAKEEIDVERGDISRSRYLLRLLEKIYVQKKVEHLTGQKNSSHLDDGNQQFMESEKI